MALGIPWFDLSRAGQRWRLRHNTAGEPILARIVESQTRLQAGDRFGKRAEGAHGLAQLIGLGAVLGVVDDDEIAAREIEREVHRLGLGARQAGRDPDDFERAVELGTGARGIRIVGLDDQFDVQAVARIVRYVGASATKARDALNHGFLRLYQSEYS